MPSDQQKHSPEGGSVSLNRSAEHNPVPESARFVHMKSQLRESLVGAGFKEETLIELETKIENVAEVFRGEVYWGKVLLLMISNDFKTFNEILVNSGKFTKEMATDLIKTSYSVIADYSKLVLRGVPSSEAFKTALFKSGIDLANFQASGLVTISVLFVFAGFLAACSGAQDQTNPNNETPPPPGLSDEEFLTAVAPSTQIAGTQEAARVTPTPVAPSKEMLENIFGQPVSEYEIIETDETLQIFGIREAFEAYQNRVKSSNEFQGEINFSAFSILVRFEGQSSNTGPYGYTFFNSRETNGGINDFRLDMVVRDSEREFTTVELHQVLITRDGIKSLAFAQTVNASSPEYDPETGNGPVLDFPIAVFILDLTPDQIKEMSDAELAELMVKFYPHGYYFNQISVSAYDDPEVRSKVLARMINFTPETPQQMGEEFLSGVEIFENYPVHKGEDGIIDTVIINDMPYPLNLLIIHQGRVVIVNGLLEVGLPTDVFNAMQEHNREITETAVEVTAEPTEEPTPEATATPEVNYPILNIEGVQNTEMPIPIPVQADGIVSYSFAVVPLENGSNYIIPKRGENEFEFKINGTPSSEIDGLNFNLQVGIVLSVSNPNRNNGEPMYFMAPLMISYNSPIAVSSGNRIYTSVIDFAAVPARNDFYPESLENGIVNRPLGQGIENTGYASLMFASKDFTYGGDQFETLVKLLEYIKNEFGQDQHEAINQLRDLNIDSIITVTVVIDGVEVDIPVLIPVGGN